MEDTIPSHTQPPQTGSNFTGFAKVLQIRRIRVQGFAPFEPHRVRGKKTQPFLPLSPPPKSPHHQQTRTTEEEWAHVYQKPPLKFATVRRV